MALTQLQRVPVRVCGDQPVNPGADGLITLRALIKPSARMCSRTSPEQTFRKLNPCKLGWPEKAPVLLSVFNLHSDGKKSITINYSLQLNTHY